MIHGIVASIIAEAGGGGLPLWMRFDPTGSETTQVVPTGAIYCTAYIIGAGGGAGIYNASGGHSGAGGYTTGAFEVTGGETLRIRVGQGGNGGHIGASPTGGAAVYPGGGNGSRGDTWCGSGGGYSGVFRNDNSPIMIAGAGGGGSGYSGGGNAGAGGGLTGQANSTSAAGGGTQSAGGSGSFPGSSLQGGGANSGNNTTSTSNDDGGGGGGYYGGGAPAGDGRTGGGGSGFLHGNVLAGSTTAGAFNVRPVSVPATINSESTTGLGQGKVGENNVGGEYTAASGGAGAIWLYFTDGDPLTGSVVAHLHMNGTDGSTSFPDVKGKSWTAYSPVQVDTAQSQFGGASALFNGSSAKLETADHADFELGSGDFTIECWVRPASFPQQFNGILSKWNATGSQRSWLFYYDSTSGGLRFYYSQDGSSSNNTLGTSALSLNTWYHVAVCRSGADLRLFLNGVQTNTTFNIGAATIFDSTATVKIGQGSDFAGVEFWNGHIDEVRITKAARYRTNFTPTGPFPET